jgi:hypothetical protein
MISDFMGWVPGVGFVPSTASAGVSLGEHGKEKGGRTDYE